MGGMLFVELAELRLELGINILIAEVAGHVVKAAIEPLADLAINVTARILPDVVRKLLAKIVIGHWTVGHAEDGKFS